jgi:hypothetical protein
MHEETERRIGDFFTGDLRLTASRPSAAPARFIDLGTNRTWKGVVADLEDRGATTEGRVESNFILSRTSFLQSLLFNDQYSIAVGGEPADDAFTAGILLGIPPGGLGEDHLRPYLVAGGFPNAAAPGEPIQLLMSTESFRAALPQADRDAVDHGQASLPGKLGALRFEVTTGRVNPASSVKDLIRSPAVVVGLYASGLDVLDRVTLVAPLQDVQRLSGLAPGGNDTNVVVAYGGGAAGAASGAEAAGLKTETPAGFAERYLGQFLAVLRALAVAGSVLMLAFPVFLLWYGIVLQTQRNQRELAVCRAIGMPRTMLQGALVRLAAGVLLRAVAATAVATVLLALLLRAVLPGASWLPVPMGFAVPLWAIVAIGVALLLVATLAVLGNLRRVARADLAGVLRAL